MDKQLKSDPRLWRRVTGEVVKTAISLLIFLAGIAFVLVMYVRDSSAARRSLDTLVPLVSVMSAEEYTGPLELILSGTVVPYREIRVAAEVGGIIAEKRDECRAGQYVRAGTIMMVIDRQNYEIEASTIEAEIRQAEAMIREVEEEIRGLQAMVELSQSEVTLIQRELDRNARIAGATSRSEVEQWERNLLAAQSQLVNRQNSLGTALTRKDRLVAALEVNRRRHERALLNLERTLVRAPSDGVVVAENAQQGDLVAVGSPLFQFEDTQRAEVLVNLSHRDMLWLQEHLPPPAVGETANENDVGAAYQLPAARVEVSDSRDPAVIWHGVLSRVDGIGRDELTRTTPVRITIDQPVVATSSGPRALVRGMFVRCRIVVPYQDRRADDRLVSIPAKALRPSNFVWTVESNRLCRHQVEIVGLAPVPAGTDPQERTIIVRSQQGAITPGVQVVVSPLSQVAPGVEVQISHGSAATAAGQPIMRLPDNAQSDQHTQDVGT